SDAALARQRGLSLHGTRHPDFRRKVGLDPGRARRARRRDLARGSLGRRIARRFGLFEIGLGYLGGVAGREPAPGPRAGRVPCLRQIPLLGLAGILAAELLTQVGLFVPIPADAADPAPETHSASLVPVGVLGAPDAPHRIAGPD